MTSYGRQDETNGHPPTKCPLMEGHTEMSLEFNAVHNVAIITTQEKH